MAASQPHLELRPTGYYWRRRVPARETRRFSERFFCFPLRTHVRREAAELARRLSAISELCFASEPHVSPELMTRILTDYACLEIEAADRLRALARPRSRAAAEAALAIEAAARGALRDAIFLCDRSAALPAIQETARRLGIALSEDEEDFALLPEIDRQRPVAAPHRQDRRKFRLAPLRTFGCLPAFGLHKGHHRRAASLGRGRAPGRSVATALLPLHL